MESPFTRIVYIARILSFAGKCDKSIVTFKRYVSLCRVNKAFREAMFFGGYCHEFWSTISTELLADSRINMLNTTFLTPLLSGAMPRGIRAGGPISILRQCVQHGALDLKEAFSAVVIQQRGQQQQQQRQAARDAFGSVVMNSADESLTAFVSAREHMNDVLEVLVLSPQFEAELMQTKKTPLYHAASNGCVENVVTLLDRRKNKPSNTRKDPVTGETVILSDRDEKGKLVDIKLLNRTSAGTASTPLAIAISRGFVDICGLLIDAGVDFSMPPAGTLGERPLDTAIRLEDVRIAAMLVLAGDDMFRSTPSAIAHRGVPIVAALMASTSVAALMIEAAVARQKSMARNASNDDDDDDDDDDDYDNHSQQNDLAEQLQQIRWSGDSLVVFAAKHRAARLLTALASAGVNLLCDSSASSIAIALRIVLHDLPNCADDREREQLPSVKCFEYLLSSNPAAASDTLLSNEDSVRLLNKFKAERKQAKNKAVLLKVAQRAGSAKLVAFLNEK